MAEELADMMDAIKDEIKAYMELSGAEELSVGPHKVRWAVINSSRFDSAAFKKTHADLYGQYCTESSTRRFTVA